MTEPPPASAPEPRLAGDDAVASLARRYEALIGRRTFERAVGIPDAAAEAEIERLGEDRKSVV